MTSLHEMNTIRQIPFLRAALLIDAIASGLTAACWWPARTRCAIGSVCRSP